MTLLPGLGIRAASEHTALTVGPDMDILKIYNLALPAGMRIAAACLSLCLAGSCTGWQSVVGDLAISQSVNLCKRNTTPEPAPL